MYISVCGHVYMSAGPQGSEEGIGAPELELQVIDSCGEPNSGLWQEQQALRTHHLSRP